MEPFWIWWNFHIKLVRPPLGLNLFSAGFSLLELLCGAVSSSLAASAGKWACNEGAAAAKGWSRCGRANWIDSISVWLIASPTFLSCEIVFVICFTYTNWSCKCIHVCLFTVAAGINSFSDNRKNVGKIGKYTLKKPVHVITEQFWISNLPTRFIGISYG